MFLLKSIWQLYIHGYWKKAREEKLVLSQTCSVIIQ